MKFIQSVHERLRSNAGLWILLAATALTLAIYWPGLSGGFLFDDYPNIVDNVGVQPSSASLPSLVNAALSSPSSEFKRPLSSLSFAANFLATGLNPFWMKLTNVVVHLANGWLIFLLSSALLRLVAKGQHVETKREKKVAALIATGWMLLPINLTGVLYVVQRMESLANVFVLLGLIGYVAGRKRMLPNATQPSTEGSSGWAGFWICAASITVFTTLGALAKETAVMLPLYAVLIEWAIFRFCYRPHVAPPFNQKISELRSDNWDWRLIGLFLIVLLLPMLTGLAWLLPGLLKPENWANRDFTITIRLLSETRIVVDYLKWTLLPTPNALSFYHDDFLVSTGLLKPWTTAASIAFLIGLIALIFWLRRRLPLAALGLALFLGCQLLTATILPLELVYEHRNYFASFGLLLTLIPMLAAPPRTSLNSPSINILSQQAVTLPCALPRYVLLAGLLICWAALTSLTAQAWGNPLRLAEDLAARAPQSPRAQYELGRTYIIYSHYDPASPFTKLAYAPLERSAALPESSILPEQALIFMNSRMHLPLQDAWWESLTAKLQYKRPRVQDESSLAALTQCDRDQECKLPKKRMNKAYEAALSHNDPSARLLAMYGDYAWNVLLKHDLGEKMTSEAVRKAPNEAAYRITLIRMLAAEGKKAEATVELRALNSMNFGGHLDSSITQLKRLLAG